MLTFTQEFLRAGSDLIAASMTFEERVRYDINGARTHVMIYYICMYVYIARFDSLVALHVCT